MKKSLLLLLSPLLIGCGSTNGGTEQSNQDTGSNIVNNDIEIEEAATFQTEEKNFYRDSDNKKIYGELYLPNNSYDEFPLVVLSHGFASSMSSTSGLAQTICKQGFATFAYDFVGGGTGIKSDGQMTEMSVLTEVSDLNTVLDELLKDERINQDNIFLLGQSQGGFVSTYVAGTRDDIKGLVDYYPAFCIRDDAEKAYPNPSDVPDTYSVLGFATVGKIYYMDATSFDIYEIMEDITCNTLLMHGTTDNVVPISYSDRASTTIPNCEYIVYENQGHGFSGDADKDSENRTINFLKENLN